MKDWNYRRMYGKQTRMKTSDMSKVEWSKAQKEHRQRFREAIRYAHVAMTDPNVRAHYEKVAKRLPPGARGIYYDPRADRG